MDDFARYVAFHLDPLPARDTPTTDRCGARRCVKCSSRGCLPAWRRRRAQATTRRRIRKSPFYGYGLWTRDSRDVVIVGHSGGLPGYGSQYRFAPQRGIGVIAVSNLRYAPVHRSTTKVLERLIEYAQLKRRPATVPLLLATRQRQVAELVQS